MNDDFDETSEPELTEDEEALLEEMPALTGVGQTRRTFLGQAIAGSLGFFALDLLDLEKAFAAVSPSPDAAVAAGSAVENLLKVVLKVNGATKTLNIDSRVVLLDALRERLALTGSKKGCDQGPYHLPRWPQRKRLREATRKSGTSRSGRSSPTESFSTASPWPSSSPRRTSRRGTRRASSRSPITRRST